MPVRRSDSEESQGPTGRGQPFIHTVTSLHQLMEVARREGPQEISAMFDQVGFKQTYYFHRSNLVVEISNLDIASSPDQAYRHWLNLNESQAQQIIESAARRPRGQTGNMLYPEGTVESRIHNFDNTNVSHRNDEDDDEEGDDEVTIWDLI